MRKVSEKEHKVEAVKLKDVLEWVIYFDRQLVARIYFMPGLDLPKITVYGDKFFSVEVK